MKATGKRCRRIALILIVAMLMPIQAFASSTLRSTTYSHVIKKGKTLYCAGATGIYKVALKKNGQIKSKRLIYKSPGYYEVPSAMTLKGKNIYFIQYGSSYFCNLYRVSTSGKKLVHYKKKGYWGEPFTGYAVKGKYLYMSMEYDDTTPTRKYNYRVKSGGTKRQKTNVKVVMKTKNSNAKGYTVRLKTTDDYYYDYLVTPRGKFLLGKRER